MMENNMTPREQKLWEYIQSLAAKAVGEAIERSTALEDYNIMMGKLEDPMEDEEDE